MKFKHTPRYTFVYKSDKTATVTLNEDDAKLFDAAHDMLDILEKFVSMPTGCGKMKLEHQMIKAIAKARGKK